MINYKINLDTATLRAFSTIYVIDKGFIGTVDYLGLAWFHNYAYRHWMRDISIAKRKQIHQALMKYGITDLSEESVKVQSIILRYCDE